MGGGVLQPEGAECVCGGYRAEQAVRGHSGRSGAGLGRCVLPRPGVCLHVLARLPAYSL